MSEQEKKAVKDQAVEIIDPLKQFVPYREMTKEQIKMLPTCKATYIREVNVSGRSQFSVELEIMPGLHVSLRLTEAGYTNAMMVLRKSENRVNTRGSSIFKFTANLPIYLTKGVRNFKQNGVEKSQPYVRFETFAYLKTWYCAFLNDEQIQTIQIKKALGDKLPFELIERPEKEIIDDSDVLESLD